MWIYAKIMNFSTFSISFLMMGFFCLMLPNEPLTFSSVETWLGVTLIFLFIIFFLFCILWPKFLGRKRRKTKFSRRRIFLFTDFEAEDSNVWNFLFATLTSALTIISGTINLVMVCSLLFIYFICALMPVSFLFNPIPLLVGMHYYKLVERNHEPIHILSAVPFENKVFNKCEEKNEIICTRISEGFYLYDGRDKYE